MSRKSREALEKWLTKFPLTVQQEFMTQSIELATAAGVAKEVPVGAIVVDGQGQIIGRGENRRERDADPTAHAEIIALRQAGQHLGNWHLNDCTLYVTLEPCPMCAGAIVAARLGLLVYGADDAKAGAVRTVLNIPDGNASNHFLSVVAGVEADRCQQQLKDWFAQRRKNQKPQNQKNVGRDKSSTESPN
jgi:tRNA(adenine34) deaminase